MRLATYTYHYTASPWLPWWCWSVYASSDRQSRTGHAPTQHNHRHSQDHRRYTQKTARKIWKGTLTRYPPDQARGVHVPLILWSSGQLYPHPQAWIREREGGERGRERERERERESHHKLRTMRCWYNRHLHNVFDVDWLWWLHRELKIRPFLPYRRWRYRIFRQWSDRYDEIEEAYFHSWRWLDLWWWTLRLRSSQKLTDSADWGKFTPLAI